MKKNTKSARLLIANAGKDQVVYARYNGVANVTLDGSKGPRYKRLKYTWYLEGSPIAMGMRPTVKLISGEHTVTLVINNGREDSEPSRVVITVFDPMEVQCRIFPPSRKMFKKKPEIMASLDMPPGITSEDINFDQPFRLYPGSAEVTHHYTMQWRKKKSPSTQVFAFFGIELLKGIARKGGAVELAVAGQLKTGQYFYGSDIIEIQDHEEATISTKNTLRV